MQTRNENMRRKSAFLVFLINCLITKKYFFSMKTRPLCPRCGVEHDVRTTGGATLGSYYYKCIKCKATWSQIPPQSVHDKQKPVHLVFQRKQRSAYACGKCGMPKKGHVCTQTSKTKQSVSGRSETNENEDDALDILMNLPALIPVKPTISS